MVVSQACNVLVVCKYVHGLTTAALQSRGSVLDVVPFTMFLCISYFRQLSEHSHITTVLMCVWWICRVLGYMRCKSKEDRCDDILMKAAGVLGALKNAHFNAAVAACCYECCC